MSSTEVIYFLGMPASFPDAGEVVVVLDAAEGECVVPAFVRKVVLETPLQRIGIARRMAWDAVLKTLTCVAAAGWEEMRVLLEETHQAARLILSEVADFGLGALAAARTNWREHGPFRDFCALGKGVLTLPAVVCGAGPSLEEAIPWLRAVRNRVLLVAAGSACVPLLRSGLVPDAVCAFDKEAQAFSHSLDMPLFMQSRLSPAFVSCFQGEKVLVPESGPLPWEKWWLDRDTEAFACGWTAGNFALRVALHLGCDPIVLTGMDLCYRGGKKYALGREGVCEDSLLLVRNRLGEEVWTQRDWVMAARFCGELLAEYPQRTVLTTSRAGLSLGTQIEYRSSFPEGYAAKQAGEILKQLLHKTPWRVIPHKEEAWVRSVERCRGGCEIQEEPVFEFLLEPLWRIWRPLFQDGDEEMHQRIFFKQVVDCL